MRLSGGRIFAIKAELAWPGGDDAGVPDFSATVPGAHRDALLAFLHQAGLISDPGSCNVSALRETGSVAARYRISDEDTRWFVRVTARVGHADLEKKITDFLRDQGCRVASLKAAGLSFEFCGNSYRVDIRPFQEGRHFDGGWRDVEELATLLSTCHAALKQFDGKDDIRRLARTRYRTLSEAATRIRAGIRRHNFSDFGSCAEWARQHADWLAGVAEMICPDFDERPGAQVLHGEIHPGNVLFRASDGAAVLMDFEESMTIFAPRCWDYAYLVQRFVLRGKAPSRHILIALERLLEDTGVSILQVFETMQEIAGLMTAVAVHLYTEEDVSTPVAELQKFRDLHREASLWHGLADGR